MKRLTIAAAMLLLCSTVQAIDIASVLDPGGERFAELARVQAKMQISVEVDQFEADQHRTEATNAIGFAFAARDDALERCAAQGATQADVQLFHSAEADIASGGEWMEDADEYYDDANWYQAFVHYIGAILRYTDAEDKFSDVCP